MWTKEFTSLWNEVFIWFKELLNLSKTLPHELDPLNEGFTEIKK